jgi:hypothetical protein
VADAVGFKPCHGNWQMNSSHFLPAARDEVQQHHGLASDFCHGLAGSLVDFGNALALSGRLLHACYITCYNCLKCYVPVAAGIRY